MGKNETPLSAIKSRMKLMRCQYLRPSCALYLLSSGDFSWAKSLCLAPSGPSQIRNTGYCRCQTSQLCVLVFSRYSLKGMSLLIMYNLSLSTLFPLYFSVTSSSALVGCIATQVSKSFFVAPIFTATPNPCNISLHPAPRICNPTTFSSGPTTINL